MLARSLAILLVAAAALPARAQLAVPVAVYPVEAPGMNAEQRGDVQGILESALLAAERRGGVRLRAPLVLAPTCGAVPTDACLAPLAKDGAVLVAKARAKGGQVAVSVAFVDGKGRRTAAAGFTFDPFLQDTRPAARAISAIEGELAAANAPKAPEGPRERADDAPDRPREQAASTAPTPAPPATAEATGEATRAKLAPAEPTPLARSLDPAPGPRAREGAWKGPAGRWTSLGGVVLLAGALTTGLLGKQLNDDLTAKYRDNALVPSDAASYKRLDLYALLTNVLVVSGGVATVTGVTLWSLAPDEPHGRGAGTFGGMGRF